MPITLNCSHCGKRIKAPEKAAGRQAKCPGCGAMLTIPAPGPAPAEELAAVPSTPPAAGADATGGRRLNGLGVAAMVLSLLALLICWVPFLGLVAWPLGGLGAILGIVAVVLAARGGRLGYRSATAGAVLGVLSIGIATVVTAQAGRAVNAALQEELARQKVAAERDRPAAEGHPARPNEASDAAPRSGTVSGADAPPAAPRDETTIAGLDRNGDGRLTADEVPERLRGQFGKLDQDDDGYVDANEWATRSGPDTEDAARPRRGGVIANHVVTAADDFIVDVYHNGKRLPVTARQMVGEAYGATSERIEVEVREGDWLVFAVANNQLRWDGVYYFAAAGLKADGAIGFRSRLDDGRWSYCDDPAEAPRFIAHPGYRADQAARPIEKLWGGGDNQMRQHVPDWDGTPVWGAADHRFTWIKFVAQAPVAQPARAGTDAASAAEATPRASAPASEDETQAKGDDKAEPARPAEIPRAVRQAAERLVPGGTFVEAIEEKPADYRFRGKDARGHAVEVRVITTGSGVFSARSRTTLALREVPRPIVQAAGAFAETQDHLAGFRPDSVVREVEPFEKGRQTVAHVFKGRSRRGIASTVKVEESTGIGLFNLQSETKIDQAQVPKPVADTLRAHVPTRDYLQGFRPSQVVLIKYDSITPEDLQAHRGVEHPLTYYDFTGQNAEGTEFSVRVNVDGDKITAQ